MRGCPFFYAMKWIKVNDGTFKFVSDDDPRPSVTLPNKKIGTIFQKFIPSWGKYEADMWNTDKNRSREAADKFDMERAHEIKTDPRAARWEAGRKAAWAKDKPLWAKQQQKGNI